jgi:DNA mismatch endonuclease, patch repair protein
MVNPVTRTQKPDPLSPEARSVCMRAVKSKNTSPELRLRKLLHKNGYRYRLYQKNLPGKPDLVFAKYRLALFVHGCFWHGHDCPKGAKRPNKNAEFWDKKITGNQIRDRKNTVDLKKIGWRSAAVYECELKETLKADPSGSRLIQMIFTPDIEAKLET